ncbi:hypothetical protein [Thalassobaculum litoreum]|uniref:hypothetical protein n=1 Tax=Thalassobaculum litoreum TaxID=420996 RepID=UPI00111370FC|nr:hypothetical protein [Thalassobaculum litoreum]
MTYILLAYAADGSEAFRETHISLEGAVKRATALFQARKPDSQLVFEAKVMKSGEDMQMFTSIYSAPEQITAGTSAAERAAVASQWFDRNFKNPFDLSTLVIEKFGTTL